MQTEIQVRPGVAADVEAMYELDLLCFSEPFRFDLETMRHYATQRGSISLVAEAGGALAAFLVVNVSRRKSLVWAYITTLDTHPDYRRAGLAARLLAEAEARAAQAGAQSMRLHVFTGNDGAIRFYEANGYEQMMRVEDFYGTGLDALLYVKPLAEIAAGG